MKKLLCWLFIALLAGCAVTPSPKMKWKFETSIAAAPSLTVPIGVVADTQFHESRGVASRIFGLGTDEIVDVTIRTGQQVIGAEDILTAALKQTASLPLVIHAGDAIDISCQTEWKRFKRVMSDNYRRPPSPSSWLFLPGNHDGYLTGNVFPQSRDWYHDSYWSNLCNAGQLRKSDGKVRYSYIGKSKLVRDYVTWIGGRFGADFFSRSCNTTGTLCWVAYAPDSKPWESFLVQLVRLPSAPNAGFPIYSLMLDSSNYTEKPTLASPAGLQSSISEAQLEAASDLLQQLHSNAKFFFITHHPVSIWHEEKWNNRKLASWLSLLQDPRSLRFLISAHTHTGYLQEHSSTLGTFVEMNTGSLADAPVYLRTLEFRGSAETQVGVYSEGIPISVDRYRCAQLLPLAETSEPDYDYDVDTQRSESDRAGENLPGFIAFGNLLRYFFYFWESKHKELRPQLLAYADVVEATMPRNEKFEYHWTSKSDFTREFEKFEDRKSLVEALRKRAVCSNQENKCSAQAKGNLLLALENYYANLNTPSEVRSKAHELRLCLAITAANDSAKSQSEVRKLYHYISKPWAIWLTSSIIN